eukprot:68138_1
MKIILITRFLTAIYLSVTLTISQIYPLWSAEHLDDLILSDAYKYTIPAYTPAIIALYEDECHNILYQTFGFTHHRLPSPQHLLISEFNRNKAQNEPWYDWDSNDWDLFIRYNISTDTPIHDWCPTVLFQPANWSQPIIKYQHHIDGTFINWALKMLQINLTVTNNMQSNIYISYEIQQNVNDIPGIINEAYIAEIKPTESVKVLLQISDIIVIWDANHNIINRYEITASIPDININEASTDVNILDGNQFKKNIDDAIAFRKQRIWMTRRRLLFNTKIPPVVPQFTELGFSHRKMPDEICKYLTDFYNENQNKLRREPFPKDNPLINAHEIPMQMLHIPGRKKYWIAEIIKPMLEEWTKQTLQFSILYGLRQYSKGAVLKGHCDKIETHVVSTILHLNHDPLDIPWPIEVYGFDKKRHYLEDAPCTMTFYESSTLIHGRPSTYNGTKWINAFLHFRPKQWEYKFTRDNYVITPEAKIPIYDPQLYG